LDPLLRANVPLLSKPNSSTNKGKGQEEILEQARDYKEDCREEEELPNFGGDLQLPILVDNNVIDRANNKSDSNGDRDGDGDRDRDADGDKDEVLATVCKNAQRARHKIVDKYSKTHAIKVFAQGDIVTVKLLQGTQTSIDNKRLYA
jgi:hypothetical protein